MCIVIIMIIYAVDTIKCGLKGRPVRPRPGWPSAYDEKGVLISCRAVKLLYNVYLKPAALLLTRFGFIEF